MKILITGGSGFLGINLVRYLLNRKACQLTVLDIVDFSYPEAKAINFINGDTRDKEVISKVMPGMDVVIHAAAALPLYTQKEIYSTEVNGTRNLLQEACKNKVDRFIHISSTAVYGVPDHHPIFEADKLQGVGEYGKAKILAEEICAEYRKNGMCIPILRPKSFIGPERLGVFALLFAWAKEGRNFPLLGKGSNRYQFLDVEDLCAAILLCIEKDKQIVNDTFNIGAKDFTTMKEDFQAVLDAAGFGRKIILFPAHLAVMILRLLEFLHLSPLYTWIYETIYKDSFVAIEKAEKTLSFKPQYSNKDALLRNYRWYVNNYKEAKIKTGVSHRLPWKQGVLNLIKVFF